MANNQYKVYVIDGTLTENEVSGMLMKSGVVSRVEIVDRNRSSSGIVQAIISSKPAGDISISGICQVQIMLTDSRAELDVSEINMVHDS
jgi:hypothetical protein